MGYAAYIGRVGALAVALGVGVAVATTPGVAWAEPTDPVRRRRIRRLRPALRPRRVARRRALPRRRPARPPRPPVRLSRMQHRRAPPPWGDRPRLRRRRVRPASPAPPRSGRRRPMIRAADSRRAAAARSPVRSTQPPTSPRWHLPPVPRSPRRSQLRWTPRCRRARRSRHRSHRHRETSSPVAVGKTPTSSSDASQPAASMRVSAQSVVSAPAAAVPDSSIAPITRGPAEKQAMATISPPRIDLVAAQTVSAAGSESTAPSTMRELVQGVLASFGLGPLATDHPTTPVDSPVGWAVLALVRSRRFGQPVTDEASAPPASATLTSQTIDGL